MKLEPTNYLTPDCGMTYGDYVIRYEHKVLRNIYTEKQIAQSNHIINLQNYYEWFNYYIQIYIGLFALLNSCDRENFLNELTEEFVEERFSDESILEIKNTINKTEIIYAITEMLYLKVVDQFINLI